MSDVEKVKEILEKVLKDHEAVIDDPAPIVIFEDFGDSALTFDLWFWARVGAVRELRVIRSEQRFSITKHFEEAGIVIAFPQRDLHFKFDNQSSFPVTINRSSKADNSKDNEKGDS